MTRNCYEVGYGKPPLHTRFRKGQSGNPKGRAKGTKNFATIFALLQALEPAIEAQRPSCKKSTNDAGSETGEPNQRREAELVRSEAGAHRLDAIAAKIHYASIQWMRRKLMVRGGER